MMIIKSIIFLFFILSSSIGWGKISLSILEGKHKREDTPAVVYPALGFGVIAYLCLIAGLTGYFDIMSLSLIYLIGFLLSVRGIFCYIKKLATFGKNLNDNSVSYKTSLALLVIAMAIIFLKTLAPPANINDALGYHLYCPKVFLANHKIFAIPYNIDCAMPFLMEMLFAFGVALKEPIFAQVFSYIMGVLVVFAIADFSKKHISQRYAVLAPLIFILTPVAYVHASYAYVELGLTFYLFMAFYMLYEWLYRDDILFLILSAIFTGLALSTKVLAVFMFLAFLLYIIARGIVKKKGLLRIIKDGSIFTLFSLVFSFVWYLRSYIIFGNPIFPYLNAFFNGKPLGLIGDLAHHNLGRGIDLVSLLRLPWDLTFYPNIFGGDRLHLIYLGLLPLTFLCIKEKRFLRIAFFVTVYTLFWFYSSQRTRFLMPMLPFMALAEVFLVNEASLRPWKVLKAALFSFICLFLCLETAALIYNTRDRFAVALGIEGKKDYLMREERTYGIATYINKNLPVDAKILATEARLFYFDREMAREDMFELFTGCDKKEFSAELLQKILKKEGFTYILCDSPPASYSPPLRIVLEGYATPIYTEGRYILYKIY